MERLLSIYLVLASWPVIIESELIFGVLNASTATIALVIESVSIGGVA